MGMDQCEFASLLGQSFLLPDILMLTANPTAAQNGLA